MASVRTVPSRVSRPPATGCSSRRSRRARVFPQINGTALDARRSRRYVRASGACARPTPAPRFGCVRTPSAASARRSAIGSISRSTASDGLARAHDCSRCADRFDHASVPSLRRRAGTAFYVVADSRRCARGRRSRIRTGSQARVDLPGRARDLRSIRSDVRARPRRRPATGLGGGLGTDRVPAAHSVAVARRPAVRGRPTARLPSRTARTSCFSIGGRRERARRGRRCIRLLVSVRLERLAAARSVARPVDFSRDTRHANVAPHRVGGDGDRRAAAERSIPPEARIHRLVRGAARRVASARRRGEDRGERPDRARRHWSDGRHRGVSRRARTVSAREEADRVGRASNRQYIVYVGAP